jgi:membrane protein DedA with SNARE-associated domain/rhodanese-related sulfurtransferase
MTQGGTTATRGGRLDAPAFREEDNRQMDTIAALFERFGVAIVFVNTLLHELGIPIPLTPTVLVAGAATSKLLPFASLVAAVVAGTLIGNSVWFAAGRRFGPRVLKGFCRISLSPDSCVGRTGQAFERWGGALFIVGRFIPGISLVAPPVAGALGMRWSKFLWLSALGSLVWATVMVVLGVALQGPVKEFVRAITELPAGTWAAVLGLVALYVLWRFLVRQRARRSLAVPRLSVAQLHEAMKSATPPIVIDVRGSTMQQVDTRRIPQALSLALKDIEAYRSEDFSGRSVVFYCACPNEASAAAGARILRERGHADAYALLGGIDAWVAAGHEVEDLERRLPHEQPLTYFQAARQHLRSFIGEFASKEKT